MGRKLIYLCNKKIKLDYVTTKHLSQQLLQLIDETVLCVHGGLSPEISMIDQIRCIDRNQQIPHKGAFCDLLWSDPADVKMW